jgi:hypothetical protein
MFAAAGIGFGGSPWVGFAIGASLIVLSRIPQLLSFLQRYRGQPKTDIVLMMLLAISLAVAGAYASAWAGYGLRYLLALLLKR